LNFSSSLSLSDSERDRFYVVKQGRGLFIKYVEKATKSLLGSMTSGEFLVNSFEGTGTVLLAPVPYWQVMMLRQITAALPKTSS